MKADFRTLYLIADNLANLYEDGIPITLSLELLLELPINKEYRRSLIKIKEDIIKGNTLGSSFYKNTKLYPKFFSGIIDIGESSGELVNTLKDLHKFYFNINKVKRRLKASLTYPLIIFISLIILMCVFMMFIIPNICETYAAMNKNISPIINFLYDLYSFLRDNKIYSITSVISFFCILTLLFRYFKSTSRCRENQFIFKFKFFKQYYEYIFMMILSIVVNSGIQLNRGLDLCIESIDIKYIKSSMESLKEEILLGNEIGESLSVCKFISKYSLSMIIIGEKSGSFDKMLAKASERLEENLLNRLERVISYVTPVSIIIVTFFIIIFLFVFIIPMLDMIYSGVM